MVKKQYKEVWRYLKEAKVYFLIILTLFFLSILIGFLFPVFFQEYIQRFIEELMERTKGMGFWELLVFILQNNISTAFTGMVLGIAGGVLPLLLTFFNGYVLGFVSNSVAGQLGYLSILRLLPHGIFEVPALIISLGLGVKLGMFILYKNKKKRFLYDLRNSLKVFVFVILPLLIIAAIIETGLMFLVG